MIAGGADSAFVVGAWFLRRGLRRASLLNLPGVGHLPFVEAPERTLGPIAGFLGSVSKLQAPSV